MARNSVMDIRGLAEIQAVLSKLPARIEQRVIENALTAGGRVIVKEAKRRVPVDSGKLRDSLTVGRTTRRRGSRMKGTVYIGPRSKVGAHAHLVEFGTPHAPAQPFLRPALDERAQDAIKKIAERLGKGLEREAEKLANQHKTR